MQVHSWSGRDTDITTTQMIQFFALDTLNHTQPWINWWPAFAKDLFLYFLYFWAWANTSLFLMSRKLFRLKKLGDSVAFSRLPVWTMPYVRAVATFNGKQTTSLVPLFLLYHSPLLHHRSPLSVSSSLTCNQHHVLSLSLPNASLLLICHLIS